MAKARGPDDFRQSRCHEFAQMPFFLRACGMPAESEVADTRLEPLLCRPPTGLGECFGLAASQPHVGGADVLFISSLLPLTSSHPRKP